MKKGLPDGIMTIEIDDRMFLAESITIGNRSEGMDVINLTILPNQKPRPKIGSKLPPEIKKLLQGDHKKLNWRLYGIGADTYTPDGPKIPLEYRIVAAQS